MRPVKRALADVLVSQYFSTAFISNRNPGMSTNTCGTLLSFSPKITVQGREEIWQLRKEKENPLCILKLKCK